MDAITTRIETEISIDWAAANPELFKRAYNDFFNQYGAFEISAKARAGFLTLVAEMEVK